MLLKVVLASPNDAALLATKCGEYNVDVDYIYGRYTVDAKSLMGILSIGLGRECGLRIHSDDKDTICKFENDMKLWVSGGVSP